MNGPNQDWNNSQDRDELHDAHLDRELYEYVGSGIGKRTKTKLYIFIQSIFTREFPI